MSATYDVADSTQEGSFGKYSAKALVRVSTVTPQKGPFKTGHFKMYMYKIF